MLGGEHVSGVVLKTAFTVYTNGRQPDLCSLALIRNAARPDPKPSVETM